MQIREGYFQQVRATAHVSTCKLMRCLLRREQSAEEVCWLPRSPDLIFTFGQVQALVVLGYSSHTRSDTIEHLKRCF